MSNISSEGSSGDDRINQTGLMTFVLNTSELESDFRVEPDSASPTLGNKSSGQAETEEEGDFHWSSSIADFALESIAMPDNMTTIFNGTSTASLREGPVTEIPTTVTITNGKVISLWIDPAKINKHYGDTPIYGIILEELYSSPL